MVEKKMREKLGRAAEEAYAGRLPWFDELVQRAGYVRPWFAKGIYRIAEFAQVSPTTLKEWWSRGCPGQEPGVGQNLSKLFAWVRERASSEREAVERRTALARAQKLEADAAIRLAHAAQLRGDLISRSQFERHNNGRALVLRQTLDRLADELAPRLYGRSIEEIRTAIHRRVEQALDEYVRACPLPPGTSKQGEECLQSSDAVQTSSLTGWGAESS